MNGMLHHHDVSRHVVERDQYEAREMARQTRLSRLARTGRERAHMGSGGGRILALATPMAAALALLVAEMI